MDYIYGKLNKTLEKVEYEGLDTGSLRIVVDNEARTIKAEASVEVYDLTTAELDELIDVVERGRSSNE